MKKTYFILKLFSLILIIILLLIVINYLLINNYDQAMNRIKINPIWKNIQINNNLPYSPSIAVLLIACNRYSLINSTLNQLITIKELTKRKFLIRFNQTFADYLLNIPILVSQDCDDETSYRIIQGYFQKRLIQIHAKYPLANHPVQCGNCNKILKGYYKVSRHYKWAIQNSFDLYQSADKLIIVEDDLNFSDDFFEYFLTLSSLLDNDNSLYCISAWNDNGKNDIIDRTAVQLVHRTDFFPGLGWMLKKSIWLEVKNHWPAAFWDDWFRNETQRNDRSCLRPEISRTSTSGKKGVSKGQFYDNHLAFIHHFNGYYPFYTNKQNIMAKLDKNNYDYQLLFQVYNQSQEIHIIYMIKHYPLLDKKKTYRINYYTKEQFIQYSNRFQLMNDFKTGIPRTAYKGIIGFMFHGIRTYLAPPITRKIYISQWT